MTPVELLLSKLSGVIKSGKDWIARCPAHDDRTPSLSVATGDDGRALVTCHAGCPFGDIVAAAGLAPADLMPAWPGLRPAVRPPGARSFPTAAAAVAGLERKLGTPTRVWTYHDAAGDPVGNVVRWDGADGKKTFRPVARAADGSWEVGAMPAPRPLFELPELAAATRVLVCEGEKAAYAARGIGLVATTSAGGANGAAKTDWSPLAGKDIWVLPDNDGPGREYARDVAALLGAVSPPARVRVVALPGLPPGGDIVDWIDNHGDAAEPAGMRDEIEQFAAATAPEPCPPAAPRDALPFRPFPVDALPEPVRGFVAAGAAAIGCDPSYLALPLLVAIGAAVGNTRRLQLKNGWQVPPLLWAAVVGESGTAKTPAFQAALGPIDRRQQTAFAAYAEACRAYKADHAVWEREFAEWKRKGGGYPPIEPAEPAAERYRVTDTTIVAFRQAIANSEIDEPADPVAVRRWLDHAQRAADLTIDHLGHLIEVLRAGHPGPADRVLKLANSLAAHADSLSEAIYRHAVASRFAAKLERSEAVDRAAADVLLDIQAAYACETEAVPVADLTPAWWADYPFRPAGERAGVFSRYREHLHGLYAGDPPSDWESAVTVRLYTAAAQMPTPIERLRRGLHNERVAFGTLGATPALPAQIATAVAVAPPAPARSARTADRASPHGKRPSRQAAEEIIAASRRASRPLQRPELAALSGYRPATVGVYAAWMVKQGLLINIPADGYDLPPPPNT